MSSTDTQSSPRSNLTRTLAPQWILRPSAHFGAAGASAIASATPSPAVIVAHGPRGRSARQQISPAKAAASAWILYIAAIALPIVVWHDTVANVASRFHFSVEYLITGWTGYALIVGGLLLLAPVVLAAGRTGGSRTGSRPLSAYAAWGGVLYLLGVVLASLVAAIAG